MTTDPAIVDSMLNPFRDMLTDVRGRGITGADVDEMAAALSEMEGTVAAAPDAAALGQTLAGSGLYQRFSDAYTRALTPSVSSSAALLSDEELLAQTLAAYRSSAQGEAAGPVREAIELGESGVSYPVFLRLMTERGLVDRMAGSIVSRDALVQALEHQRSVVDPAREAMQAELLAAHDELVARSPFGVVDPFEFELADFRIRWEHEPGIASRDALIVRWGRLLELVVDWLDSFCSFAPGDDRWVSPAGAAETQRNIERTRECGPGFLGVREALVAETWGLGFEGILGHESYAAERAGGRVPYSEGRVELARATRPHCVPDDSPPPELIGRAEELGRRGTSDTPAT